MLQDFFQNYCVFKMGHLRAIQKTIYQNGKTMFDFSKWNIPKIFELDADLLRCSFRDGDTYPTVKCSSFWTETDLQATKTACIPDIISVFFLWPNIFYFSLWPFSSYWLNTLLTQRASMVTNHKACCQNMTNHQKSKQNFSKTKKYRTKRHEWEGCKSCNYSTLQRLRAENTI